MLFYGVDLVHVLRVAIGVKLTESVVVRWVREDS